MTRARYGLLFAALAAIVAAAFVFALAAGSASIAFVDAMRAIGGAASSEVHALVIDLRLPRALTAFAVGGLLAVAGVLMQVLLRNPLADPYILGVSGGAAVFALVAIMLGLSGVFNLPAKIWGWWIGEGFVYYLIGGAVLGLVSDKVDP